MTGEAIYKIDPLYVYDSFEGEKTPENPHETTENSFEIEKLSDPGMYLLTYVIDRKFLQNENTVYPVIIDPNFKDMRFAGMDAFIGDTVVYSGKSSCSHSSTVSMFVGYHDYGYSKGRALFDISNIRNNSKFQGLKDQQINFANLVVSANNTGGRRPTLRAYEIASSWYWKDVTWNHMPSYREELDSEAIYDDRRYNFDITGQVKKQLNYVKGTSTTVPYGVMIKNDNESDMDYMATVRSHDITTDDKPYVVVNFGILPEKVTIKSGAVSQMKIGDKYRLYSQVAPDGADERVTFKSSNPGVVEIRTLLDTGGADYCALKVGTATITVESAVYSPAKSATFDVTVKNDMSVSGLLIYQTENLYRTDKDGIEPEDIQNTNKTKEQLLKINHFSNDDFLSDMSYFSLYDWENLTKTLSMQPLQDVGMEMINHFMSGKGTDYRHDTLTKYAKEHGKTVEYLDTVKKYINDFMKTYNGDITKLEYIAKSRDSNPLVDKMKKNKVNEPVFDSLGDKACGLTILVDSLYGNKISVKSYISDGIIYSGILTVTLYDHYGLNQEDVMEYGTWAGFRGWYKLQHYDKFKKAYKPFVTVMEFDVPFSGTCQ